MDEPVQLRPLTAVDIPLAHALLAEASGVPLGLEPASESDGDRLELARWLGGWGRPGDTGFVAGVDVCPLGAGWYRLDPGGASRLDDIVVANVVVLAEFRRRGIGSALLRRLLEQAYRDGYRGLALNGAARAPAWQAYARLGFKRVGAADDWTLIKLF